MSPLFNKAVEKDTATAKFDKGASRNTLYQNVTFHGQPPFSWQPPSNGQPPTLALPKASAGVKLIARDTDMEDFIAQFSKQEKICVVSGIGGVGKTEFVKTWLRNHAAGDIKTGWFDYRGSFRDTLLDAPALVEGSSVPRDDPKRQG